MSLPTVVIVGRPNVGKSTLYNALAEELLSIVDPTAGVTRDRVSTPLQLEGTWIELVDTGGIGMTDVLDLERDVERQIEVAMAAADLVLFVVDAKDGILPVDREIAGKLRRLGRDVITVANKAEGDRALLESSGFYSLGFGEPSVVSAKEGGGLADLRERICETLPTNREAGPEEGGLRIAIVGRMNSGKSTLANHFFGAERCIVSDRPGTTRDSIDVAFERGGHRYVAVDTAGIRKLRVVSGTPDYYAQLRSERAIRRADVVLFLLDATCDVGSVDRRIAESIVEAGRPCVVTLTKWDLVEGGHVAAYENYLEERLPFLGFAPVSAISTHSGVNINGTLALARELYKQSGQRASTGELNRALQRALVERAPKPPRGRGGRMPKIYYVTQAEVRPPTMIIFVNDPKLFPDPYMRFLAHRFREIGPFAEIPVKVYLRRARDTRAPVS